MLNNRLLMAKLIALVVIQGTTNTYALDLPSDLDPDKPAILGEAYDLKDDSLVYREFHYIDEASQKHWVIYKAPNDELLVEKALHYRRALTEPDVTQANYLCGEELAVTQGDGSNRVDIQYQADEKSRLKEKSIKRPDELVIDAGFNQYLQNNWDSLVDGDDIVFEYLAPSQLKTFPFIAKAVDCEVQGNTASMQCFTIAPKKWWLKLALDPILLSYSEKDRQLLSFAGMGNVADKKCDYMEVNIRYQYPMTINN